MTEWAEQWICIQFLSEAWTFLCGNYLDASEVCSNGQPVIGNFITTMHPLMHHISYRVFFQNTKAPRNLAKHQSTQDTQPAYGPVLAPYDFWLFPKLKSVLKGKRFQTVSEIQENWGVIFLSTMFLVFCIFFNKSLYFSYYKPRYFLDRPHIYIWMFYLQNVLQIHLFLSIFLPISPNSKYSSVLPRLLLQYSIALSASTFAPPSHSLGNSKNTLSKLSIRYGKMGARQVGEESTSPPQQWKA